MQAAGFAYRQHQLMAKRPPPPAYEPLTRERVLVALRKVGGAAQKRDIARELGIGPDQKKELRHILRELEESGALGRTGKRSLCRCASTARIRRHGHRRPRHRRRTDRAHARPGRLFRPAGAARAWRSAAHAGRSGHRHWRPRARAHRRKPTTAHEARVIKRLGQSAHRILGVFRAAKTIAAAASAAAASCPPTAKRATIS